MSLVTRCPACATTFKVVRDQLRISDGWVRCGRCSNVFDATLDLHESGEGTGFAPLMAGPSAEAPAPKPVAKPPSRPPAAEVPSRVVPTPSFEFPSEPMPPSLPPASPLLRQSSPVAREPAFQFDPFLPESQPQPAALPPPQPTYGPPAGHLKAAEGASEEADFLDEDPAEHLERRQTAPPPLPVGGIDLQLPTALPTPAAAPAPALSTNFLLPPHGLIADESWSDLEVREPEWRPPPSSLPPFPNIDLTLSPPSPSPPPAPPLPLVPPAVSPPAARVETQVLVEPASDEAAEPDKAAADDAPHDEEKTDAEDEDKDQARMQKALRRARAKSAKIAGAKARDSMSSQVPTSVMHVESEPDVPFSPNFEELDEELRLSDDEVVSPKASAGTRRPAMQRGLAVLCVLAILALAVQVLRHERDGIVARQPSLRPALAALCAYTGCELSELRQIGDIVIEGAAFAREKSGTNDYRLSFTLRNSATVPLAMPAIELSLLDTQERAVVRRVLMPGDYGASTVLAARGERVASLPLTLTATEAAALPPVAGYRVEAFYP